MTANETPYRVTGLDPDNTDLASLVLDAYAQELDARGAELAVESREQGWLFDRYLRFAMDRDTERTRDAFAERFGLDKHTAPQRWYIETSRALSGYRFVEQGPYVKAVPRDDAPEGTIPLGLSTYVAELNVATWFDGFDQFHVWVPNLTGGGAEAHTRADLGRALQALRDAR